MKTIYVTQNQWQSRTLDGQLERAVGDTGRMGVRCLSTAGSWCAAPAAGTRPPATGPSWRLRWRWWG